MRFKQLIFIAICLWGSMAIKAASADWYLYFWSYTSESGGDAAQFETTDNANIFVINDLNVTEQGVGFCIHNATWSVMYGWSDAGGSVTATGTAVTLATSTSASGWLNLPVGTYNVTFDASVPSVRFDRLGTATETETEDTFLRGGDLTMVTYMEDWGTKFKYRNGTEGDVFDILQSYGVNFARLRLYNTPGTAVVEDGTTYRTPIKTTAYPNGYPYAGPEDILSLAARAKAHNMKICLSFHLSDFWSNAGTQLIPSDWASVTTYNVLKDSVTNYVMRFMQRMVAQGTTPEYVSIGNETNWGMLFQKHSTGAQVSFGGHGDQMNQFAGLFNAAYSAVKAVSPATQVIFHHAMGHDGGVSTCQYLFNQLINTYGMNVDIIGGSYYPYWASLQDSPDNTPTGMLEWASAMETRYGKPIMIMETGYSWTQYRPSGRNGGNYEGQLHLNGSYNEATEAGQESFMRALHAAIASDENIIGYLYWDPIFVDQKVNNVWIQSCWAERKSGNNWYQDGNVVSNTTWFDYTGLPLSVLYREIASYKSSSGSTTAIAPATDHPSPVTVSKVIQNNQLLIIRDNHTYSLLGMRVK